MANPLTNFTVTAQTRHPRTHKGYDARTHGYLAGYVRPSSWRLTLDDADTDESFGDHAQRGDLALSAAEQRRLASLVRVALP